MATIKINPSKSVEEWKMKEWGSWEDSGGSPEHAMSILEKVATGKPVEVTGKELDTLIVSCDFNATSWGNEEIKGGAATIRTLKGILAHLKEVKQKESFKK